MVEKKVRMKIIVFISSWFLPGLILAATDPKPVDSYAIQLETQPAFCNLVKNNFLTGIPSDPVYDLIVSSFSARLISDKVSRIEGVSKLYKDSIEMQNNVKLLTEELIWPNEVVGVPDNIFTLPYVTAAATGFFPVPTKTNGSIALMDMTNLNGNPASPVVISYDSSDPLLWYYHRLEWHDMNGDGYRDIVTARANGGGPSADVAQLVWFENPRVSYQLTTNWEVHILNENVEDVHFRIHDLPYNGGTTPVIISSGFYSNVLSLLWSSTNNFSDLSSIRTRTVDNYGWYFDVEVTDINLDGKVDVLTTTWSQKGKPGAVLAYEIPDDWTTEPWTRHILQDGYKDFLLAGTGSPGGAQVFCPSPEREGKKPYIMVSGDDDTSAYVLTPNDESINDWTYTQTLIYQGRVGVIGGIGVADVDGDGYAEVFIPAYNDQEIIVMSYNERAIQP